MRRTPPTCSPKQIGRWPSADVERLRAHPRCMAARGRRLESAQSAARTPATRAKHLHGGFDAFRTLKLIHALRASGLALDSAPRGARPRAPFVTARDGAPLEEVREQLAAAEREQARLRTFDQDLRFRPLEASREIEIPGLISCHILELDAFGYLQILVLICRCLDNIPTGIASIFIKTNDVFIEFTPLLS